MVPRRAPFHLDAARRLHREFVLALGGFSLEVAGGALVTHERIPVPAFNYVDGARVGIRRQSAFFERVLDHYFQRALRPSFRVDPDAPPHIDATLRRIGFVRSDYPLVFLVAPTRRRRSVGEPTGIEAVPPEEASQVAGFWTRPKERDEFERAITVLMNHPDPDERLVPIRSRTGTRTDAAALLYRRGGHAEVSAVSTLPELRGRGIATALVAASLGLAARDGARTLSVLARAPRLSDRLAPLGFAEVGRLTEYLLPAEAELALPAPGPPAPPRWRPPRAPAGPG